MGLFSSALNGAVEGAQEMVLMDTFDRYQNEINVLNSYIDLLTYGATFYKSLAAGQMVNAACYYGSYKAAKDIMKRRYNDEPENYKYFMDIKKKYVTQYINQKQEMMQEKMARYGMQKVYATVNEIRNDEMDFFTAEELIADAMIDPEQENQNPSADTNYVSPFGPFPSKEEKKKEKSSYWLFGKK